MKIFGLDDPEGYLKHLAEEGYAVIGNVLDEATRNRLVEKFWNDWTTCSPNFSRTDKTTWKIENSPMMFAKGMAIFSGLPHGDFMWDLRLQPNIKQIFANIHGTDNLVSSFDGFSVFFTKKQKTAPWLHTDQNPTNKSYCVQGQYNFFPVKHDSAGFIVVPKSHLVHKNIPAKNLNDWVQVSSDDFKAEKIIIPENCFTIWDSRTIHANTGMTSNTVRFDRLTCYVTYLPKDTRSEEVLKQKITAYKNSEGTSHWANRCEIKKYPWGFGPRYETRGFTKLKTGTDTIPEERLAVF